VEGKPGDCTRLRAPGSQLRGTGTQHPPGTIQPYPTGGPMRQRAS